jgi:hypothetical protein
MMPAQLTTCSMLCALLFPALGGAHYTIDGRAAESWSKGALFVIVATVKAIEPTKPMPEDATTHRVTLVPHATLGGSFDASLQPEIVAPASVGVYGTSIKEVPAPGSLAIVVMLRRQERPELCVAGASISFVPGTSALTVVAGWDDPRIAQTLKGIQIARGALPDPTTQPSTRRAP